MSELDRRKWQARYEQGRGYQGPPDPFLDAVAAHHLPRAGRALDLAGGTGRHARWLARRGFDVTLADISPAALAEARREATAEGVSIRTLEIDLDTAFPEGPFDVILVTFFLVRDHLGALVDALRPGGKLVLVHPTRTNLQRHPKPSPEWLLDDGELDEGIVGLETVHHEEGWSDGGRHEVRLVARKPTSAPARR